MVFEGCEEKTESNGSDDKALAGALAGSLTNAGAGAKNAFGAKDGAAYVGPGANAGALAYTESLLGF